MNRHARADFRRREFLGLGGGAALAAALPRFAWAQTPPVASLRLGFIGAGREGGALGTLFANASGPLSSDVVVALYATVLAGAQVKDAGEANTFKTALQTAKLTDGAGAFQLKKGVTSDTLKQVLSVYNGQGALDRALAAKLAPPAPAPAKTGIAQAITAVTPLFKNPTPAPTQAQIVALFGLVLQPGLTAAQVANLRQAAGSTLVDGNGQPILNGTATMDQLKSALTAANADGSLATALKTALQ